MRMKLDGKDYSFGFGEKTLASGKKLFEDLTDAEGLSYREPTTRVEGGVGAFDLIWDNTDHFNFLCNDCGSTPKVKRVIFGIESVYPTLFFHLCCQECGRRGQRKIKFNLDQKAGMMRATEMEKLYDLRQRMKSEAP